LKRLEEQHRRMESKVEAMYEDRLEGRITLDMYDRKALELRAQLLELTRGTNEIQASASAPVQDAIDLMALTSREPTCARPSRRLKSRYFLGWC
jgi:site-specific DNA recombinase